MPITCICKINESKVMLPTLCHTLLFPSFYDLIFTFITYHRAGRTSLLPYTSCTFKITIAPRRILHIYIHGFHTIFHMIPRRAPWICHHLVSWALVLQRWVVLGLFILGAWVGTQKVTPCTVALLSRRTHTKKRPPDGVMALWGPPHVQQPGQNRNAILSGTR